jgi:hypothetical protein
VKGRDTAKCLQDTVVTQRRPRRPDGARRYRGSVRVSCTAPATGATLFLEPMAGVDITTTSWPRKKRKRKRFSASCRADGRTGIAPATSA